MSSISNLKTKNYNVKKANFLRFKEIADYIIDSIAIITATITGLNCLQIDELQKINDIDINKPKNSAINLWTTEFNLTFI